MLYNLSKISVAGLSPFLFQQRADAREAATDPLTEPDQGVGCPRRNDTPRDLATVSARTRQKKNKKRAFDQRASLERPKERADTTRRKRQRRAFPGPLTAHRGRGRAGAPRDEGARQRPAPAKEKKGGEEGAAQKSEKVRTRATIV